MTGARQWSSFLSLLIVFSVIVFFVVATPRCLADANASPPLLPERQYKALRVGHLDVEMRDHATEFTAALISPINRGFRITSKQHGWSPRCRRWGTRDTRRLSDSEQTDQKLQLVCTHPHRFRWRRWQGWDTKIHHTLVQQHKAIIYPPSHQ